MAGMSKQWVISAHIPKVERSPIKKTHTKSKDSKKGSENEGNANLNEIKTSTHKRIIRQMGYNDAVDNNLPFSVDPQVEYMSFIYKTFSKKLKLCTCNFITFK